MVRYSNPIYKISLKSILNLGWVIACLFSHSVHAQRDTSDIILSLEMAEDQIAKMDLISELCDTLLVLKEYNNLSKYALQYLRLSNQFPQKSARIDALYFLVKASYSQRDYEKAAYYSQLGEGITAEAEDLYKIAYFHNIQGIAAKRSNECQEAIQHYQRAVEINKEIPDRAQLSRNYNNMANCFRELGDYASSLSVLNEALTIRTQLDDISGIGNIQMNIGNTYDEAYNYEKAVEHYLLAQESYEKVDDKRRILGSLLNTGLVYQKLNNYKEATKYYHQVETLAEEQGNKNILRIVHQNLGNIFKNQSQLDSAVVYQKRALGIAIELEQTNSEYQSNLNLGLTYRQMNDYDQALTYLENAYDLKKYARNSSDFANVNLELGRLYTLKGNYNTAARYIAEGQQIAENNGDVELLSFAQLYNYEIQKVRGRYKSALNSYEMHKLYQDSLNILEQEKSITRITSQYNSEKQEAQIELLNKENALKDAAVKEADQDKKILYLFLLLSAVLVGGLTFLSYYSRKKRALVAAERDRAESLLLNILPAETAQELSDNGRVQAVKYDNATVIFTDFVLFSDYSEKTTPEEIVRNLDYYFRHFDFITDEFQLEKIKTIGDAYMCVSGVPVYDKKHAEKAIRAAQEFLKFVIDTKENPPAGITPFNIRIGINSGPIVAGIVGTKKFQYDIWGNTVNVAAKMEGAALENSISISESTYELIKDQFDCVYRGEVTTKHERSANVYSLQDKTIKFIQS